MTDGLTGVTATTEKDSSRSGGARQCELVKSQAFSTSSGDASTSGLGETEGAHGELGDIEKTLIVGDGPDEDGNLSILSLHEAGQLGEGDGGTVGLGHTQPLQDSLVEVAVGSASQEAVELHQEEEVRVLGLGGSPVAIFRVLVSEIDTLHLRKIYKEQREIDTKRKTNKKRKGGGERQEETTKRQTNTIEWKRNQTHTHKEKKRKEKEKGKEKEKENKQRKKFKDKKYCFYREKGTLGEFWKKKKRWFVQFFLGKARGIVGGKKKKKAYC